MLHAFICTKVELGTCTFNGSRDLFGGMTPGDDLTILSAEDFRYHDAHEKMVRAGHSTLINNPTPCVPDTHLLTFRKDSGCANKRELWML